ncbi:MAG: pilus assembly protein TadC, partial [Nitrosarchaeum sp.]
MKTMTAKQKRHEESVGVIHVYSYKLLNEHIKFLYPKLKPLEKSIKQAMMPIPFEVYVSSMVFFSIIAGICGAIIGLVASQFISIQPPIIGYLLSPVAGLVLMVMTFGILQIIPP